MRARLVVEAGDCSPSVLELASGQTATIGRSRENLVVIPNDLVSRLHAKVYFDTGNWYVRDFGLNGTKLDGQRITGAVALHDGNMIQCADVQLRFLAVTSVQTATPLPVPNTTPDVTPPPAVHRKTNSTSVRTPTEIMRTKVQHYQSREIPQETNDQLDPNETQLKVDELTTLCRFMTEAVTTPEPHELISRTLRTILNQTSATLAGYLSLDPNDTMPKVVLPEKAAVDMRLSRRLTERVRHTRKKAWLYADDQLGNPGESLQLITDAVCLPLAGRLKQTDEAVSEPFAALHVYRTGRGFTDREVRFLEIAAGFLAPTLEILRTRRKLEAENHRLRSAAPMADELIGDSSSIMALRMQIGRAAPQPFTVLIQGESGSGKELVALALHQHSQRAEGPLVVVNCAAIAPTQLETELFGCRKGTISGADRDYAGLFEQADEGTLVLDEVGELSLDCQAKLLRVIEGKAFRPVGGTRDLKVDVRLVAATNRDLEAEVRSGRFRQELFFRLKVIHLRVPPLREHSEDIPELAHFFLERLSGQCRRTFRLTAAAIKRLQAYPWPGNVRQLRAVLESAAVMTESDTIDADSLPLGTQEVAPEVTLTNSLELPQSLDIDELETWAIRKALVQTGGNVSQASRLLGMSRDTLHTKIKKKAIDRETLLSEHG